LWKILSFYFLSTIVIKVLISLISNFFYWNSGRMRTFYIDKKRFLTFIRVFGSNSFFNFFQFFSFFFMICSNCCRWKLESLLVVTRHIFSLYHALFATHKSKVHNKLLINNNKMNGCGWNRFAYDMRKDITVFDDILWEEDEETFSILSITIFNLPTNQNFVCMI
jgi:hypothetical protein